jgi:hypothetical protein
LFFPPVAFLMPALPRAGCIPNRGHRDIQQDKANLGCGHAAALPKRYENSVNMCGLTRHQLTTEPGHFWECTQAMSGLGGSGYQISELGRALLGALRQSKP